jgi:allantoinase
VLPDRVAPLDVVIDRERIVELSPPGTAATLAVDEVIDAGGLLVLPGMVDAHVHFDDPGRAEWEGFDHGSAAAAAGGVTTVVDMPIDSDPPTTTVRALEAKIAAAEARSRVDVALWAGLVPHSVDELGPMIETGAVGAKAFGCPSGWDDFPPIDSDSLARASVIAAALDVPIAVHCEWPSFGDGPESEVAAVRWAAAITSEAGARLHVVHASAVEAVDEARRWPGVTVETCPHYLVIDADQADAVGPRARCAPPIRSATNRAALWDRLRGGTIDIVASDHSPCPPSWRVGPAGWRGIAGVQLTIAALLDAGVAPVDVARLTTAAGRLLRLSRKGAIQVGNDADVAIVDETAAWTVTSDALFDRHRASPLVGRTLRGQVARTLIRGRTVFDRDHGVCYSGGGRFVRPSR